MRDNRQLRPYVGTRSTSRRFDLDPLCCLTCFAIMFYVYPFSSLVFALICSFKRHRAELDGLTTHAQLDTWSSGSTALQANLALII